MKKPFLAIASFLLMSSAARAENYARDFFSVSGVPAAASSSSSSEAKKRALDGAREKAFFSVIKRLLKSSDVEGVVAPDSYNMDKFIEKYRISNEKMTPSSYSATVDVQIGRALMEEYLRKQGYRPTLDPSPAALVVPVYGGESHGTEWSDAFEAATSAMAADAMNSNIVPIVLPMRGDASNFGRAGVERIRNNPLQDLGGLMSRYGASDIFSAELSGAAGGYSVEIESRRTGESVSFTTTDDDLSAVAMHAVAAMNDIYKGSYSASDMDKSVPAVVPVSDLSDWLRTEKELAKIREIKEASTQALKYNKVQLVLRYNYSLEALVSALRAGGFSVEEKDGYLILRK